MIIYFYLMVNNSRINKKKVNHNVISRKPYIGIFYNNKSYKITYIRIGINYIIYPKSKITH